MGQALDELIEVRGARLRVRTAGKGPAVLLIHGWTLDLDMWTPQFATLADRYRLIAFDRRGYGLSTGAPGIEHDLADIEQLLAAAVARTDRDRRHVAGRSRSAALGGALPA